MDSDRQRVKRERRLRQARLVVLLVGIAALSVLGLRLAGVVGQPFPTAASSPTVPVVSATSTRQPTPVRVTRTPPGSEPTLSVTLTSETPGTPADAWAAALLDKAMPILQEGQLSGEGLAWWQNQDLHGTLAITGSTILVGDAIADASGLLALTVEVPEPGAPSRLMTLGRIDWQGGALHLTIATANPDEPAPQWLLSSVDFPVAIRALVVEATEREMYLRAAYSEQPGREAQIVLVGIETIGITPSPSARPTESGQTPPPTATSAPTRTATPTREPEAFMGRVLAERLAPILDSTPDMTNSDISTLMTRHPWAGVLTWTESGPFIAGRSIPLAAADTLYLYAADPNLTNAERWLVATTDGSTTHLPEEQIIFQGRRLDEILYWLVREAGEHNGQLVVTFDDFGARQAVTVVGFKPFSESS